MDGPTPIVPAAKYSHGASRVAGGNRLRDPPHSMKSTSLTAHLRLRKRRSASERTDRKAKSRWGHEPDDLKSGPRDVSTRISGWYPDAHKRSGARSIEQSLDDLAPVELERSTKLILDFAGRIDAQRVVDGRAQVRRIVDGFTVHRSKRHGPTIRLRRGRVTSSSRFCSRRRGISTMTRYFISINFLHAEHS